jgi:hypothetical protein
MEGERKEEKGRGRDGRPGAGPSKIFGLEPPLAGARKKKHKPIIISDAYRSEDLDLSDPMVWIFVRLTIIMRC